MVQPDERIVVRPAPGARRCGGGAIAPRTLGPIARVER